MKKLFLAAIAVLMASSAMALNNEPKQGLTWQALFGFNASRIHGIYPTYNSLNGTDPALTDYDNGKCGVNLGFKAEYMLPNAHGTYINAGLDWTQKGAKKEVTRSLVGQTATETNKINAHYIELPIHVGFRYNITKEWGVYGELGPYFAVGLGGKMKNNIDADGDDFRQLETSHKTFKSSTTQSNFQRFDCGMGFRIGGEYANHYSLNLGCDWGFTDMYRDDYRDAVANAIRADILATGNVSSMLPLNRAKNFCFTMTFGYRF